MYDLPLVLVLAAFVLAYALTRLDRAGVWDRMGRRLKRAVGELVR